MPKVNVYLPDDLAEAVRRARVPISAVCQRALEDALRGMTAAEALADVPCPEPGGRAKGPFRRFTDRARRAVALAQDEAVRLGHNYVGTEHLLLGMVAEGGNAGLKVLKKLDVEPAEVRAEVEAMLRGNRGGRQRRHADMAFTPRAKKVFELALREAVRMGHDYVGCEHVLLGLLSEGESVAARVLNGMGVELVTTRRTAVTALTGFGHTRQDPQAFADDRLDEILRRLDALERRLGGNDG